MERFSMTPTSQPTRAMKMIFARLHANGVIAEVLAQPNGLYKAQELSSTMRTMEFTTDIADLERAKQHADTLAHPGCLGDGCGPWRDYR